MRPGSIPETDNDPFGLSQPRASAEPTPPVEQPKMSLAPSEPHRITIEKLGIDAQITAVGLTKNGEMDTPGPKDIVGWYKTGYLPGSRGNAVLAGHYWHKTGRGIFYNLQQLAPGDTLRVTTSQRLIYFRVESSATHLATDDISKEVFGPSDTARLNLVTCTGPWIEKLQRYRDRFIVFATFEYEEPLPTH